MRLETSNNSSNICPNCGHQNRYGYLFCENCGQKNRPLKVKFFEFISDFFSLVLNLDNKFWRTLKGLFIPARLTTLFHEGKRKSYYHPLRLYLVVIIFFFTVLSVLQIDNLFNTSDESSLNLGQRFKQKELVREQIDILSGTLDSLKSIYPSKTDQNLIDSISNELYVVYKDDTTYLNSAEIPDTNNIKLFSAKLSLTSKQMFQDDIDEVITSSEVESYFERLILKQILKGSRDLGSLNKFVFANLTWLFIAIVPIFSLVLKLFYIRRKRYFMEHFVFLLHLFSALIAISSIFMLVLIPYEQESIFISLTLALVTIFPFLAFKFYYKQGFFKTLIKFVNIGILFLISFLITFALFFLITAALF